MIVAAVILPAFLIFEFANFQRDYKGFKVGLLTPTGFDATRQHMHLVLLKRDALFIDCRQIHRSELPDSLRSLLKTEAHPTLLLDADSDLAVTDVVDFVDEANGTLPGIKIVLVTAKIDPKSCSSSAL